MGSANNNPVIEHINIGIVGHIDHGKTTLLEKLTGIWASRHSEELKRGITIKLGYADCVIYKDKENFNIEGNGEAVRHVCFVDAPGHEMLMATMLSGAAMIDAAILVVAANEGIKPQTREHLMALKSKGVSQLIAVQNKIDLVKKEEAESSYKEIRDLLDKNGYSDSPIIPISAQQGVNVNEVLKRVANMKILQKDDSAIPIFIVARSFDINKPGFKPENLSGGVLGGTLKQGILKTGDEIEIKPGRVIKEHDNVRYETLVTKIKGLYIGNSKVDVLKSGGSSSIETELDMSMAKGDSLKGSIISLKGNLPDLVYSLKLKFELFPEIFGSNGHVAVENIKTSETLMLSVNTSTTGGSVQNVKDNEMTMRLKVPVVAFSGDSVGIARNIGGHWRLIGHGKIL